MQSEQQQRIMGYFIEEAKDHLNTIEQSLLSLQSTMEDPEMANEVFRAAHSVKGGAAMLGLNSIQQTAHRLEDCFKILKESSVQADQRLESLFLQVFDTLEALVEQLQTPLGLTDEIADSIMLDAEPVFEELNTHLEQLVRSAEGSEMATTDTEEVLVATDTGAESLAWQPTNVQPFPETKQALPATFKRDVLVCLREMLQLFKQNDLPEHREVLQEHCRNLYSLGEELGLQGWSELLETSRAAIACPQNSYRQLAGLVIKEIKQAQELVLAGQAVEVAPSEQLKALVPQEVGTPTAAQLNDSAALDSALLFSNSFNTQDTYIQDNRDTYIQDDTSQELNQPNHRDTETREHEEFISASSTPRITISSEASWRSSPSASSSRREGTATSRPDDLWEPEVGMAELNSLADIFEGQTPDLDQTWQEEEIISLDYGQIPTEPELSLSVDEQNDFSDLIDDLDDLESSAASASASDDVTAWLGNDVQDGLTSYDYQSTESPQSDEFDDILTWSGSEARSQDERFSETTSSMTDDFSDLLFEEESRKPRTSGAMNTEDLNSLFGDSFFEEDSSPEESTVLDLGLEADTVLDVQQQDVDPFAMPPAEAFSNEDSEQLETRTSSFLPDPNFGLGDLLDISESAREAEQSLEISEEFTLESLEAPTSEENLAFTEELGSEDEDIALGFDDLAFDDETVDDFDFAPDNIQRPTDLDLEDFLAIEDDLDFSEFQDWEEEGEPDEALAIDLEEESVEIGEIDSIPESEVEPEGVESDEPDGILASRDRQEEALANLQASDLDFDLDTTLVSHLNFDEEEASMDDQLANEAEDVQSSALDDSEGFDDFLEQQTAYTESLLGEETAETTDELDLSGLELEEVSLEEDSATSEATSLDWDLETEEQITALETAEMFEWEEPQSTETSATDETFDLESLLSEETAETTDELDLSGLELEEVSLEEDSATSEAASLDWDLETEEQQAPQETQASIFDWEEGDLSEASTPETSATDETFDLESLLGEETAETTDELDLSGLELEEVSLEEDSATSEAASLDWDLETEEQQAPQETQVAMFDWEEGDLSEASTPEISATDEPLDLESLLSEETPETTDELDLSGLELEDLDLSGLELEEVSLEEDAAVSEDPSLDWDLEAEAQQAPQETQVAMFDWDEGELTEASTPEALATDEAFNLESLLGEETPETTDELDLSGLELDQLSVQEDSATSEAASLDWDLEAEVQQTLQETQAAMFDWDEGEATAIPTSEAAASDEAPDLETLLGEETLEETSEEWDFGVEAEATAAASQLDWGVADGDESDDMLASFVREADEEARETVVNSPELHFDELEAILSEDTTPEESESSSLNDFAELEAMLSQEGTPVSVVGESVEMNALDELEALLAEETQAAAQSPASAIAAAQKTSSLEEDFADLDKLLEQADQTLGGATPAIADARQSRSLIRPRPRMFEQTMRVPVKHLDSLSNLVGELVVNRNSLEQDQERLRQFLDNLNHQVAALGDVGARMQDLYERSLLESSLLASRQHYRFPSHSERSSQDNSSFSSVEYDPLEMDRFTGFHLLSQEMIELIVRVREAASDIEFLVDETDQVARMLRQVTTQLQEGLTRSRMVPFAQTADRLPRAVREISMKLHKEAELIVEGRETLIDKMILEHLYDPLTHLVNNAITHGIEPPNVRKAAGKPPVGQITIRALQQGNQTIISVSDDGAGIDPQRVRAKALEKKLISPAEAKSLNDIDLHDFLFHPGFTTKDKADDFSGRGVGMDVVRTSLSECRGSIHIDSSKGKGTTFTIRLPLTLSICKALCCLSDRARLAFPMDGVEDMLDVPSDRIQTNAEGQTCIPWRDSLLPFQPLAELLTYNRHISRGTVYGGKREDDMISIVVLRSAGNHIAVQVDQVLGEQEIVIKQLEGPAPKPVGIAGATVLGDGRIMAIADVLELIDLSMGRIRKDGGGTFWSREDSHIPVPEEPAANKTEPLVLIVDDSITVRELLSMTFSKSGYRVEQARDGQEAWDKLRSGLPCDIVFCDIEMPRMDGLELLSRLQKDEKLHDLPIAMLTSRGADRHRQMAAQLGARGYFTKPYLEEVLLEAAQRMIKGEVLFGSGSST